MTRWLARSVALLGALWAATAQPAAAGPFSDWAAVVVAGDWHAHSGGPTEAFDNARRDVARALGAMGFQPANLRQFSVRPERYRDTQPAKAELRGIYDVMSDLTQKAAGGCLIYVTCMARPRACWWTPRSSRRACWARWSTAPAASGPRWW
ncbi:hypothetical protein [Phenylobacterium sp. J367]|uniref:hypothetical protein n=1 Tax=Phenylobacterium sp. J367 TaxID=2898435 RepID=UPI0027E2E8D8|nr:hypothetical protein [Phenylobacterium sp. J367]